jgi:hypothetical protein
LEGGRGRLAVDNEVVGWPGSGGAASAATGGRWVVGKVGGTEDGEDGITGGHGVEDEQSLKMRGSHALSYDGSTIGVHWYWVLSASCERTETTPCFQSPEN